MSWHPLKQLTVEIDCIACASEFLQHDAGIVDRVGVIATKRDGLAVTRQRVIQPGLSRDEIRQILRECVTVVKPGETLIVRGTNWTPGQTREIQQVMDEMRELGIVPFKALAVFGDELGVVEPQP